MLNQACAVYTEKKRHLYQDFSRAVSKNVMLYVNRVYIPWFQRLSCYKVEEGEKEPLVESVDNLTSMFESVQNLNFACDWVIIITV